MANALRKSDIYIFGAIYEACSNSLLEALHCGIPCVVKNDASNPEILKDGGELFDNFEECLKKIEIIRKNYDFYRSNIKVQNINERAVQYLNFINQIHSLRYSNAYRSKKLRVFDYYKILIKNYYNLISKLKTIIFYEIKRILSFIKTNLVNI